MQQGAIVRTSIPVHISKLTRLSTRWGVALPNLALWMTAGILPLGSVEPPQPQLLSVRSRPMHMAQSYQTRPQFGPSYQAKRNRSNQNSNNQLVFNLPNRKTPGNRQGGGSRDQGCVSSQPTLTALIPDTNFGYTTSPSPKLYWYVPPTKASTAEFVLQKMGDREVFRTTLVLNKSEGIVELSLSQTGTQLEVGQDYIWSLSLQCDVDEPSGNLFVQGGIQRIALTPTQQQDWAKLSELERPRWYANAGIWFDSVESLVQLRHSQRPPSAPEASVSQALSQDWQDLLQAVTLDALVSKPFLPCCSAMLAHP